MNNLLTVRPREQQYLAEGKVGVAEKCVHNFSSAAVLKNLAANVLRRRE